MQSLPKPLQKRLANEFRFAAVNMAATPDLATKLYFFSAFYGELHRILNQSWSPELALAHLVLKEVHQQINGRLTMPAPGGGIPDGFSDALDQVANELAELFAGKQVDGAKLHKVLARASELGYVVTGNGYYLYLKGDINISIDATTPLLPPAVQSPRRASSKASRSVKARP